MSARWCTTWSVLHITACTRPTHARGMRLCSVGLDWAPCCDCACLHAVRPCTATLVCCMLHVASYVLFRSNGSRLSPNGSGSGATPSSRERENTVGATLRVLQQVVARGAGLRCVARCIASRGSACHRRVRIRRFLPPVIPLSVACHMRHRRVLCASQACAESSGRGSLYHLACKRAGEPAPPCPARPALPSPEPPRRHQTCSTIRAPPQPMSAGSVCRYICLFVCLFAAHAHSPDFTRKCRAPRAGAGRAGVKASSYGRTRACMGVASRISVALAS